MNRIKVGPAVALPLNAVRQVVAPGQAPVAIYRLADGFYATDDLCSHGEANLSEGEVEGSEIVCPFHLGKFDIRTGLATAAPCFAPVRCC